MATIRPFRGLRYNTSDPLSVALVTAPPYDCISPEERDELHRTHPHNIVRLILGRERPGDNDQSNWYLRAADLMHKWIDTGILVREKEPALYFYQQEFSVDGDSYVREGFLARVGLEEFGAGRIFPHEETMPAVREDRLRLIRATRANLSPIFSLFPDPDNLVTNVFHGVGLGDPVAQTVDGDGVVHRLFAFSDPSTIERVVEAMADKPLFIADGHHRYETAFAYRKECEADRHSPGSSHPAASVLMLCVSLHHPGLAMLPTHRVLHGLPDLKTRRLRKATEKHFQWEPLTGAEATSSRLVRRLRAAKGHAFGLWTRDTAKAFILTFKNGKAMDRLAADHSKAWRNLDVAILQRVVFEHLLPKAVDDAARMRLSYVRLAQQAFDAVHEDGADAAFLMKPMPVHALQDVAGTGERMPPKSTYFYPKALSGVVINLLD